MILPIGVAVRSNSFIPTWKDHRAPSLAVWMWTRANKRTRGRCPWPQVRALYEIAGEIHVSPENFAHLANTLARKDPT